MQNVPRLLTFLELVTDKHVGSLVAACALENAQLASAVGGDRGEPLHGVRIGRNANRRWVSCGRP